MKRTSQNSRATFVKYHSHTSNREKEDPDLRRALIANDYTTGSSLGLTENFVLRRPEFLNSYSLEVVNLNRE
jgi:hypothetical protein